jgi:hypothetical protein
VADIETTALAAQALLRGRSNTSTAQAALRYLTRAKDSFGTWQSTQATILSLKAFLASLNMDGPQPNATILVSLNGGQEHTIRVTSENADVVHSIAFDDGVQPGDNRISLRVSGQNAENLRPQRPVRRRRADGARRHHPQPADQDAMGHR